LGNFVQNDSLLQQCAAKLRSNAPSDMFKPHDHIQLSDSPLETCTQVQLSNILTQAYEESRLITEAFSKTFYLGTQLLPIEARKAVWAIYVWCRRTDEIVDAPRDTEHGNIEMLADLGEWEVRLERLFYYGIVEDVLDLALLDCRINYPALPIEPFIDMIRGMLMDVPALGKERYETFDDLHLYCYRVAGTVGLMSMPIIGCATGYTEEDAKEPALSLGVAFQITNILRDIGEDAITRGRIYLPRQDMEKFSVTEEQIKEQRVDDNFVELMKHEIARARMYYKRAKSGVQMLDEKSRLSVQISLDVYAKILDKIEENNYDSLTKRAYLTKWEKFAEIPFSWYRTTQFSHFLQLPSDKVTM